VQNKKQIISNRRIFMFTHSAYRFDTVQNIFNALHLPYPDEEAEASQIRLGQLVGLDDYGAVIRIEKHHEKFRSTMNPFALRPLLKFVIRDSSNLMDVELCPAVGRVGISPEDHYELFKAFKAYGYEMRAEPEDDCAYLPYVTEEFPNGLPVLIVRTDLTMTMGENRGLEEIDEKYRNLYQLYDTAQNELYGDLIEKARAAVESKRFSEAEAEQFWRAMQDATHQDMDDAKGAKRLCAAWKKAASSTSASAAAPEKHEEKSIDLAQKAACYAAHIRQDPFHARLIRG